MNMNPGVFTIRSQRAFSYIICLLGVCTMMVFAPIGSLHAEEREPPSSKLTVSANGQVFAKPDLAKITLGVETAGESFAKVQQENSRKMDEVNQSLRVLGIKDEHIQTSAYDITPQYAPRPRRPSDRDDPSLPPKIIGYTARNTIVVEVHDLPRTGAIVDQALRAGANRFSGVAWLLQKQDEYYLEALGVAAKRARQKATTLADSLNLTLLNIVTVQEGGVQVYPKSRNLRGASMSMMESGNTVPLSPGQMEIKAFVTLVFKIKQRKF
jgi:uncharacterized protein YggE